MAAVRARRRSALGALTRTELLLLLREPVILFWCIAFPAIVLVVIGSVKSDRTPKPEYGGVSLIALYVPILIAFSVAMVALNALPPRLATYRERGILRRLQTTPVGAIRVVMAQVGLHLAAGLFTVLLLLAISRAAFNVGLPTEWLLYLFELVLTSTALLSIGTLIASLASNARAANAFGTIVFLPMQFFAGLWVPREVMGSVLLHISNFTPLGAGVGALQDASSGASLDPGHLAVMAVYALAGIALAVKSFRWD